MLKKFANFVAKPIKRFHKDEDGPTMVEYGLLVALIAIVVLIAAIYVGTEVSQTFDIVGDSVNTTNSN